MKEGRHEIRIAVPGDIYKKLNDKSRCEGFFSVPIYVRHVVVKDMMKPIEKKIEVELKKYDDIEMYVEAKGFGSIESFATFAMESVMQRNPLTDAQKRGLAKLCGGCETMRQQ